MWSLLQTPEVSSKTFQSKRGINCCSGEYYIKTIQLQLYYQQNTLQCHISNIFLAPELPVVEIIIPPGVSHF